MHCVSDFLSSTRLCKLIGNYILWVIITTSCILNSNSVCCLQMHCLEVCKNKLVYVCLICFIYEY